MESKINLFKQFRAYYSFVFNSDHNITPIHSSLYMFLLNQNNRANWIEWFKCPYDTAMHGALINSNKTYYKTLNDLVSFGLIEVIKGVNNYKAPKIKIIKLKYDKDEEIQTPEIQVPESSSSVNITQLLTQLPTLVTTQLTTQLTTLVSTHKDRPITKILLTIHYKDDNIKTWKNDFEIYKKELSEAYNKLISDSNYISERQNYHPGIDILKSLEKSYIDYWIKESGWKNKKQSRSVTIDWMATFNNALSSKMNQVWKTKEQIESEHKKTY
jgi:hypothetical protein